MLHRYWFTFEKSPKANILNHGCGVTAFDLADAKGLLEKSVFPVLGVREISAVIEDIDVSMLEKNHVQPNIGSPGVRGVWFPVM